MKRFVACAGYMLLIYGFIFLPVVVLVLFSFQDGRFPVPPLRGLTLQMACRGAGRRGPAGGTDEFAASSRLYRL